MNMTSPSTQLSFYCFLHKDTCDILLEIFGFTEIASIFIGRVGRCIEVYKQGEIKTWYWDPNNLWLSEF